jgi:hypothetical protein
MIVGLVGFIGSGKNTVANHLVQKYGYTQDSFAHSLKDACSVIFNWPRELLEGDTEESRVWRERVDHWWSEKLNIPNFTPRYAMQHLGTNTIREHFHKDLWTLSLEHRLSNNNNIVISDARFPNEIDLIRKQGGIILFIDSGTRPEWYDLAHSAYKGNIAALERMKTIYKDTHESEWSWIGVPLDGTIYNTGTLCELKSNINDVITRFMD